VAQAIGTNAYTFVNLHHALVYGAEVEYSKTFKLNSRYLFNDVQIIGNVSFNFSDMFEDQGMVNKDSIVRVGQPMVGQSPYLLNLQVTSNFKNKKGNITLSGFYQGDRTVFLGDNSALFSLIQRTGVILNLSSAYKVSKRSQLRFKIDNILNVSDILYNDINGNKKLDMYDGYITTITGDNIFSHRRDPAVVSFAWVYTL
jgi:outer membrane receptor protein involved in Fe transport